MSNRSIQNANQEELRGEHQSRGGVFYHSSGPGAPVRGRGRGGGGRGGSYRGRGGGGFHIQNFKAMTRQAPDYSLGGDGRLDVRSQKHLDAQKEAEEALEAERLRQEERELLKDAPAYLEEGKEDDGEIKEKDEQQVSKTASSTRDRSRSPVRSNFNYDNVGQRRSSQAPRRDDRRDHYNNRDRDNNYRRGDRDRDSHRRDDRYHRESRYGDHRRRDDRYGGGGKSAYQRTADKVLQQERNEKNLLVGAENEAEDMLKLMGMGGFGTSKGKKVKCNKQKVADGKNVPIERKYRQYMNRKGGFNRPLDYIS